MGAGALTAVAPALLAVRGDLAESTGEGNHAREPAAGIAAHACGRDCWCCRRGCRRCCWWVPVCSCAAFRTSSRSRWVGILDPVLIVDANFRGLQLDSVAMPTGEPPAAREPPSRSPGVVAVSCESMDCRSRRVTGRSMWQASIRVQRLGRFNYQATTPDYFKAVGTAHPARPVVYRERNRQRGVGGRGERVDGPGSVARQRRRDWPMLSHGC